MTIRKAAPSDLDAIERILAQGRGFLYTQGLSQWQDGWGPNRAAAEADIRRGEGYALIHDDAVCGYAALIAGTDDCYTAIRDGAWDASYPAYLSIHRMAIGDGQRGKGLGQFFLKALIREAGQRGFYDVRIDTHPGNHIMQKAIGRAGFVYAGRIRFPIPDGERKAYQWTARWQIRAAAAMEGFLTGAYGIEKTERYGSILAPETLDVYSDVDMRVFLRGDESPDIKSIIDAFPFGPVFGYEIHRQEAQDTVRICFTNGWRFDVTFIYPQPEARPPAAVSPAEPIDGIVQGFWYMAVQVLVKLGRGDYLVAAHLALELCQLVIVTQMLERDRANGTNIHRFGGREDVPVLFFPGNTENTRAAIERILFRAAELMDGAAAAAIPGYTKRGGLLAEIVGGRHENQMADV